MSLKFGLHPWNQVFSWEESLQVARDAEDLGYEQLWTWEHALAVMGEPDQATFDAYTLLAGWSQHTSTATLGVLVGANTFWNPGLLAKKVTTLDHISRGRAILGLGAGWFEPEHNAFGIEFGSGFGDRLSWLDEAADALRGTFRRQRGLFSDWRALFVEPRPPEPEAHSGSAPAPHRRRR